MVQLLFRQGFTIAACAMWVVWFIIVFIRFRIHVLAGPVIGDVTQEMAESTYVSNMQFAADEAVKVREIQMVFM